MTSPAAASISTRLLLRVIVLLIAIWSLLEGTVLVGFHGVGSGALGAGVSDLSGQRLVGAHLLVLVPAYVFIAWRIDRYAGFIWLPFAAQTAFALTVAYAIIIGDTDFGDGVLAAAVSAIFAGVLGFVWITEQRSVANASLTYDDELDDELPDEA
jgi:hypothetical protein